LYYLIALSKRVTLHILIAWVGLLLYILLYLSVSTRAVIGQFSGLYSTYGLLKFKAVFVAKMFRDLSPSVVNLFSK